MTATSAASAASVAEVVQRAPATPADEVSAPSWHSYIAFRRRAMVRMAERAGGDLVEEHGLVGLVSAEPGSRGGLVVSAPVPVQLLDAVLQAGTPQWVALLPPALHLAPAVAARGWDLQDDRTTMARTDLSELALPPVPPEVTIRPVAVRQGAEGYPLEQAILVDMLHGEQTPAATRDLEIEAQLLRRLPGIRYFAAVTEDGTCAGTAGSRVVERAALVAAVATVPAYRRRGIGTALTAAALRAAAQEGATEAYLDSTAAGVGIYGRLGFREIGPVRWCERSSGG